MAGRQLSAGIDIGGTNTAIGLVDRDGNILAEDKLKTALYSEVEKYPSMLIKLFSDSWRFEFER